MNICIMPKWGPGQSYMFRSRVFNVLPGLKMTHSEHVLVISVLTLTAIDSHIHETSLKQDGLVSIRLITDT